MIEVKINTNPDILPIQKEWRLICTMLRQQQAEIEKLGSELDRIVELYTDKAIENEALKKARCVACGWNPNLIGGEK